MIKFFRHIRKSLIENNQMGKYFKYAIGEILLVVIGILIALQINNWNENRIAKTIQKQNLQALKDEFQNNLKTVIQLDSITEIIYTANKNLLNNIDNNGKALTPSTYLITNREATQYPPKFNPSPGILNDLINSGQLSKIDNRKLRLALNKWMVLLEEVKDEETELWQHREKIIDYFQKHQSMRKVLLNEGADKVFFDGLEEKFTSQEFSTGLEDPYYDNLRLFFGILLWSLKEDYYPQLKENINSILLLIESELKND